MEKLRIAPGEKTVKDFTPRVLQVFKPKMKRGVYLSLKRTLRLVEREDIEVSRLNMVVIEQIASRHQATSNNTSAERSIIYALKKVREVYAFDYLKGAEPVMQNRKPKVKSESIVDIVGPIDVKPVLEIARLQPKSDPQEHVIRIVIEVVNKT